MRWRPARLPPFEAAARPPTPPLPPIVAAFYGVTVVLGAMAVTLAILGLVAHAQVNDVPPTLPSSAEFLVWTLAAVCGVAAAAALAVAWLLGQQAPRGPTDPPAAREADPDPPGPGQESVWDYPRPPRVEPTDSVVEIRLGGQVVARTTAALRVLETSHPPTYYLPATAFAEGVLRPAAGSSYCEWKGDASYLDVVTPARTAARAAWTYPRPSPGFEALVDHVAVMPGAMDACTRRR